MPGCLFPATAYYAKAVNPETGRRSLVFDKRKSLSGIPIPVPCSRCINCKLDRAYQWSTRCMQEKRMHAASAFLTLTYSPKECPQDMSLKKRDLQLFMKRLRIERPSGLRFFASGEYGEKNLRPHYHVLLLNTSFPDMKYWRTSTKGHKLYVSAELDGLWKLGNCEIGDVTNSSCSYVAGYVTKKITGPPAKAHYQGREPEFAVMSRRPGIGMSYYQKYRSEAYKHDSVIVDYAERAIPRYYDTLEEVVDPQRVAVLKRERRRKAKLHPLDNTHERRKARERFAELKHAHFKKEL